MSDDKISLDFLGEQMMRMHADLRDVNSEQRRLESELRTDMRQIGSKVDGLETKVDRLNAKVDAHDASNKARFDQIDRTMASNLDIMLTAYKAGRE